MASTTVTIMVKNNKKKSRALGIVVALLIIIAVVLAIVLIIGLINNRQLSEAETPDNTGVIVEDAGESTHSIIHASEYQILPNDNGIPVANIDIDMDEVKKINSDACGWLYIPDTGINCAIVCNTDNPDYYLSNDIESLNGVFIQNYNSSEFSDRMTVVYCKNQNNVSQFTDLLKYQNKSFFDEHRYMYVKTGNRILTYKVFAARKAYAEHLMLGYDWSVDQVFLDYLIYIIKSDNLDEQSDVETALDIDSNANIDFTTDISVEDKILTLSQRIEGEDNYRYLVQGVLINEDIKEAP